MTAIRREDLARVDFADIAGRGRLPEVHPGGILLDDFLVPLGISQYRLCKLIDLRPRRINEIVRGNRGISADTALRLARFFDMTAEFWINLQTQHDLRRAKAALKTKLAKIKPIAA